MKTLVFANQKGGVGKSAISSQLAYYLVNNQKKVLFIDLDHQANSSKSLKKSDLAKELSIKSINILNNNFNDIQHSNFDLIYADKDLIKLEKQADKHNQFATNLKKFLSSVNDYYDICIIDTNPNPDIRMIGAMCVGDYLISPIQLNQEALDGIGALKKDYEAIKGAINPNLKLIGILPNLVESTPFQKKNFEQLIQYVSDYLIKLDNRYAFIPTRTAIAEAQAAGVPVNKINKTSAQDAYKFLKPIFEHIQKTILGE